jgi:hypothetical protein
MLLVTKIVHVLALGLWFGMTVFFTFVVGLSLFATMDKLTAAEPKDRELWLPAPPELERERPSPSFPDPLRKEQGSRIAGAAVGPLFDFYFGIQLACAVLALATTLPWWFAGYAPTLNKLRALVLTLALGGVLVGWFLDGKVSDLRVVRSEKSDVVLKSPSPDSAAVLEADRARAEFFRWHTYSLIANLATVVLVAAAMAMAANLPSRGAAQGRLPQ